MTATTLTIHGIKARPVIAPMKRPIRTAIGTIPSAPLVLIDVFTDQGAIGRSYLFAYIPAALAPLVQLIDGMAAELKGHRVAPVERMRDFDRRFRLIGWQGLIGMAISGPRHGVLGRDGESRRAASRSTYGRSSICYSGIR